MYSSVLSSQQNSRLSQIDTPGFSAHPGQFSVRLFKTPTLGSYYGTSKYDLGYRSAAPSNYYSSSRYEEPPSRFPAASDPQRSSQYPTSIRTSGLASRDYPGSRPPNNSQANYTITRGNVQNTYIYEQSDICSASEYDDTATNESYSPISPTSPAMSSDSLVAMKSPLPSPLPDRESTDSTRHSPPMLVPPSTGSTVGRSYPSSHEDVLRSGDETHFRNTSVTSSTNTITPIPIPPSTSTTDTRPPSTSSGSYTTPTVAPPPSSAPPAWHHAIPTIPPSEADTEDVSLEARMNAEYNAVSTASLYTSSKSDGTGPNSRGPNPVPIIPIPIPPTRGERSSPPYTSTTSAGNGRSASTRLHVTVPGAVVSQDAQGGISSSREPNGLSMRSPASSAVVESLEEGRATGYTQHRNSTVMIGERDPLLPPFADDRWVNDQERDRRGAALYQRVPVPPPAPELRREYSNTNATCASSPPRNSIHLPSDMEDQRLVSVPPTSTSAPRQRRDSRASYNAPPSREEPPRRSSDARDKSSPRSSPPRQEEARLDTSPGRRNESVLALQFPDMTSSGRTAGNYGPSGATPRPDGVPPRSSEPYGSSSRTEHRAAPPNVSSGAMYRPQSAAPPETSYYSTYGSETSRPRRSQSNSPPEIHRKPAALSSNDPYQPPTSDPHRNQTTGSYRSQSTVPPSNPYRAPGSSEPYRPQSTAPHNVVPASSYQSDGTRPPSTRVRTNSGSWSRPNKTPSPPSRHAQTLVPRSDSRPTSPTLEVQPPRAQVVSREPGGRRERRSSIVYATSGPQATGNQALKDILTTPDQRGSTQNYTTGINSNPLRDHTTSPPRDVRTSPKRRDGGEESDYSIEKSIVKGKPILTVRNPTPHSETSSDRTASPSHVQQLSHGQNRPHISGSYNSAVTPITPHARPPLRRSTLPHDSRTGVNGQININDYGRLTTHLHPVPEQPQRRLSDGDHGDRPSFTFNGGGRGGQLSRCVRWNDNLICPSPVFPNRRKGWFNRRGDQLWTNEGAYKTPQSGNEYPVDLDDYPEFGQGWMNEEGMKIGMDHRLIPKAPLRSALKQPKPLS